MQSEAVYTCTEQNTLCRRFDIFYVVCFFTLLLFLSSSAEGKQKPSSSTSQNQSFTANNSDIKETHIQNELEKYLGVRYKRGGTTTQGLDCSGFARLIYKNIFGVELPHNASSQYKHPASFLTKVPSNDLQTGDLIFFASTSKKKRINHVGIYLSDRKFIHAELQRGIIISSLDEHHWQSRLVSAKRLSDQEIPDDIFASEHESDEDLVPKQRSSVTVRYAGRKSSLLRSVYYNAFNPSLPDDSQHIELDYAYSLLEDSWNIHLIPFREKLSILSDAADLFPVFSPYVSSNSSFTQTSYSQGLTIASDIKPVDWLSITPSFTYFDDGNHSTTFSIPLRSIGLGFNLGSLSQSGWSLSTTVEYASLMNPDSGFSKNINKFSALDMSLTYRQKLTDRLQLSLMGQRFTKSSLDITDDTGFGDRADQRFYFMFNYSY